MSTSTSTSASYGNLWMKDWVFQVLNSSILRWSEFRTGAIGREISMAKIS